MELVPSQKNVQLTKSKSSANSQAFYDYMELLWVFLHSNIIFGGIRSTPTAKSRAGISHFVDSHGTGPPQRSPLTNFYSDF